MSTTTENWFGRLSPRTAKNAGWWFNKFLEWKAEHGGKFKDMSPDELVEYQKGCDNGSCYEILDMLQRYIASLDGLSENTKLNYYRNVRSFFKHNRAALPQDEGFRVRGDIPKVTGKLDIGIVRDVVNRSRPAYKAIFISMLQGALDGSMFDYWNLNGYDALVKQLRRGGDVVKIDLPGRKANKFRRPYYTFIGADAVQAIRQYLEERPDVDGAIFLNQFGKPIRKKDVWWYWSSQLRSLGHIRKKGSSTGNRYGFNPHEMRDLFRSQWEKSGAAGSVAEFMMGHVVDPLGYNKAYRDEDWTMEQYQIAEPMLNILSSDRAYGLVKLTPEQVRFNDLMAEALSDKDTQEKFLKFLAQLSDKK